MNASPEATGEPSIPRIQRVIAILWPGFLTAGVATIVAFTLVDPQALVECGDWPEMSRLGVYTLGFFFFWTLASGSSLLTCYFQRPCDTIDKLH